MVIEGKYYQAESANFLPARLSIQANDYQLYIENETALNGTIEQLIASDRLGNITRKITLPNGSIFETRDNDAVDSILNQNRNSPKTKTIVHKLEQNMKLAIFSVLFIITAAFSTFKWGLPAASELIAKSLPASTNQMLSRNAIELLDKHIFEPSELSLERQNQINQHFINSVIPLYKAKEVPKFKLHFRLWKQGEKSIPNALALPSGDLIVTDRFIELAENQDQIDIVLLHEMGHVIERHSLERVIEGSIVVIAISIVLGDVNWLADIGVGVGSFLISSFYSRNHESEADQFAYEHGLIAGINPNNLGDILMKMEQDSLTNSTQTSTKQGRNDTNFSTYFSSHPSSSERTKMGKDYLRCFEQGIINCSKINMNPP